MKVLSWNVRGGSEARAKALASRIRGYEADIIMLTEVSSRSALVGQLQGQYPFQEISTPVDNRGAAVLSRMPLTPGPRLANGLSGRCAVGIAGSVTFMALYGPSNWQRRDALDDFWTSALAHLSEHSQKDLLVSGDFNLGLSSHDNQIGPTRSWENCADPYYRQLCEIGYIDAWRAAAGESAREFSYYPAKRGRKEPHGRRLDHAFASSSLAPRIQDCRYDHSVRERLNGRCEADHSALLIDFR